MDEFSKSNQKREIKYDCLRIVASFAIIMVHALPPEPRTSFQWWFHSTATPILLSFVGIYFMLSGLLILDRPPVKQLCHFYWHRFCTIVIPLFLYSAVYVIWDWVSGKTALPLIPYLLSSGKAFFNGTIPSAGHLWFMYTLLGLYIGAPFLSQMLQSLSTQRLHSLLWLMILLQGASTYGAMAGLYLPAPFFIGWTLYFILGYGLRRIYQKEDYPRFLFLGLLSLVITLLQKKYTPNYTTNIHDLAPTMIFIASSIFLFFEFYCPSNWKQMTPLITAFSRYSYPIYLIHFLILQQLVKPWLAKWVTAHYLLGIITASLLTFFLSFVFAVFFDQTIMRAVKLGFARFKHRFR